MKTAIRNSGFLLLGITVGLLIGWAMDGKHAEDLEQEQYCEMVALYRADPTVGWPDFNESYDRECANEDASR